MWIMILQKTTEAIVAGSVEMLAVWCGIKWSWLSHIVAWLCRCRRQRRFVGNAVIGSVYRDIAKMHCARIERADTSLLGADRWGGYLLMCAQTFAVVLLKREKICHWYSM